jgi:hypothetical protein
VPDVVATQTLVNNARRLIMKFTNVSDSSGEAAVVKVDVSSIGCTAVVINRVIAATAGMSVDILWDATTDVLCWHIPQDTDVDYDFSAFGLRNNSGDGKTGDVSFTTVGHANGDRYSIILDMTKVF